MNISQSIVNLKPYQAGKSIEELRRETGIKEIIKLASNENPLGISEKVSQAVNKYIHELNRYPDSNAFNLKQSLSKKLNVKEQALVIGNGSNELLELIAKVFISNSTEEVIFSQYAFPIYALITKILGATPKIAIADNFGHNLDAISANITKNTKLIFIANPNNPTGTILNNQDIYHFLQKTRKDIIVVLDQAYIEYLQEEDVSIKWLDEFDNLIITRTFSKAYGLAGLRIGYSISNIKIADYINRIRPPFNVNTIGQIAAISALSDSDYLQKTIINNKNGMQQLESGFKKMGLSYIPSAANFIAFKVENANNIFNKLLQRGLIVRPVEMDNYIRVSIGTKQENKYFINELKKLL